jgi:hypothetical protein
MVCAGGLRVPRSARNAANHSGREPSVSSAGPGHPRCRQYFIDDRDHPRIPNVLKDSAIGGSGGVARHVYAGSTHTTVGRILMVAQALTV